MKALLARDLLQVWDRGLDLHPVDQALAVLILACPEKSWEDLASLSMGQRDTLLLALRELTFGPTLEGFADCPECQERSEFSLNIGDLLATASEEPGTDSTRTIEGFELRFRLPNSLDLAAIADVDGVAAARDVLVRRCVSHARRDGTDIAVEDLPESVISALAELMVEQDPLCEIRLNVRCPQCQHEWTVTLDIISFFWTEIDAQVGRLLSEVHILARAYGWRESDIIDMSARRRRLYLEMVA